MKHALPSFSHNLSEWYNTVVYAADLADQAPVKGCIIMKPYGHALWENMQNILDAEFKKEGVANASFPLLIPRSFIDKESEHVEGFAPELAVVTHAGGDELEEPLVVRPTSETIIHHMFGRWVRSWRDLPLKINQWCSVVRWEKRSRPFLRTTEFWWQEGHTAHATKEEAHEQACRMHSVYRDFMERELAIPVIAAEKPSHERFAGALRTYTLEAFMPDAKALQMGTSHHLSPSFAESFDIVFQNDAGTESYVHLTSWGVTTRMIGAVVMAHGDDKGLCMPPRVAPTQVVIVPIRKGSTEVQEKVVSAAHEHAHKLRSHDLRVVVDDDPHEHPGAKFYAWELKGVPLRIEVGPRDVESDACVVVDRMSFEKTTVPIASLVTSVQQKLEDLQKRLFKRAQSRLDEQMCTSEESIEVLGPKLQEGGIFFRVGWSGDEAFIEKLAQYSGTIRCIMPEAQCSACCSTGKKSVCDVIIAKAY